MMHAPMINQRSRVARLCCGLGFAALSVGCSSTPTSAPAVKPAEVTALDMSGHPDPLDRDRLALSRFVGAWDFEGWYDPPGVPRREAAGLAACTIEHDFFLLFDIADTVEQAGNVEAGTGSMLFSAEPGLGLMLTAWSDHGPSVQRFRGNVEADGSYFVFNEIETVTAHDRLRMVMRFETDDRWVAEFFRKSAGPEVMAASYTFKRAM